MVINDVTPLQRQYDDPQLVFTTAGIYLGMALGKLKQIQEAVRIIEQIGETLAYND